MNQDKHIPKSVRIFENKNVWITLLKTMLPQMLIALMSGLYLLVNQVMMNKIIPFDGVHDNEHIWKNYKEITDIWNQLCWKSGRKLPLETANEIIRSANAISLPVIITLSSIALWPSMGIAVMYGSNIGKRQTNEANKIWTSSLLPTFLFCLIITIVIAALDYTWMYNTSGASQSESLSFIDNNLMDQNKTNTLSPEIQNLLKDFYKTYYQEIVRYSFEFTLPIILAVFLWTFVMTATFCLNSEGKQIATLIFSISCNVLNIFFDFVLMKFGKLGMLSGGLGVSITLLINALILVAYLAYLNKRSATLMTLNFSKYPKTDWMIFASNLIIGLSSFLRNISSALTILLYQQFLLKITISIGTDTPTYWLNFSGATMPIYNLLFNTALGIVRAMRMLFAYHLSAKNITYVKKSFLIGTLYSIIISAFLFVVIANQTIGLKLMSGLFDLEIDNSSIARDAVFYLQIILSNIILCGLTMASMTFFQVGGRTLLASATAILSGIGFAPIIYSIFNALAIQQKNETIYIYSWLANGIIAGITIFLITVIHIFVYVKADYEINDPIKKIKNWLKKKLQKKNIVIQP